MLPSDINVAVGKLISESSYALICIGQIEDGCIAYIIVQVKFLMGQNKFECLRGYCGFVWVLRGDFIRSLAIDRGVATSVASLCCVAEFCAL